MRSMTLLPIGFVFAAMTWAQDPLQKRIIADVVADAQSDLAGGSTTPFDNQVAVVAFANSRRMDQYVVAWLIHDLKALPGLSPADREVYDAVIDLLEARVDKQVGATPESSGTTSVVMKGAVPRVLGVAVENGALTREVDGTTVTFRGSPRGLLDVLRGNALQTLFRPLPAYKVTLPRLLESASFAVSFDTSRGTPTATGTGMGSQLVLLANRQQLASWSARAELVNQRDESLGRYRDQWLALARSEDVTRYYLAYRGLAPSLRSWTELEAWYKTLEGLISTNVSKPWVAKTLSDAQAVAEFERIVTTEMPKLSALANPPVPVLNTITAYATNLRPILQERARIREYVLKGTLITADYTLKRDPSVPDLSTITAVGEFSHPAARAHDLTVNLAWSFFNQRPATQKQFRDFKLAGQYELPLGAVERIGAFTLALAGRYEYLPSDTPAASYAVALTQMAGAPMGSGGMGMTAMALKGHIGLFQAKLTLPVKGTGVKVPLSFTWSNRTELIKEQEVRANFGLTFDLDTVFARALSR